MELKNDIYILIFSINLFLSPRSHKNHKSAENCKIFMQLYGATHGEGAMITFFGFAKTIEAGAWLKNHGYRGSMSSP
jgi:hypothetical protein